MESIVMIIGMIAAFLAGAYVRKPFVFVKKEKEVVRESKAELRGTKPTIDEQWSNFLAYAGEDQGDTDED